MDAYGLEFVGFTRRKVTAVTQASSPYGLYNFDSGQVFTNEGSTGTVVFSLPTITDDDDDYKGMWFTFVKLAGQNIAITAQVGEYIADSSAGGQVQNVEDDETYATITLVSVSNNKWMIEGAHGSWVTV